MLLRVQKSKIKQSDRGFRDPGSNLTPPESYRSTEGIVVPVVVSKYKKLLQVANYFVRIGLEREVSGNTRSHHTAAAARVLLLYHIIHTCTRQIQFCIGDGGVKKIN